MSEFRVNSITNQDGSAGPQVCGVSTFTGNYGVRIPSGSSDFRRQDGGGRGRCVAAGGASPSYMRNCEKIEIATTGNATSFGELSGVRAAMDGCSSSTRGVIGGGGTPSNTNIIEYITMSSEGGANDFGDLTFARQYVASANSSTRGLSMNSYSPKTNSIEFVTIATTGNATDFGDSTLARQADSATSSPTRGVCAGGEGAAGSSNPNASTASPFAENLIDFVTIATLGNAQDFGDRSVAGWGVGSNGNSTRGIFFGVTPSRTNIIDFITIAAKGNSTDFGDLLQGNGYLSGASSQTRSLMVGGTTPSTINVIQFVTISTTGNASDFGDLNTQRARSAIFSDSNGGLAQ